MFIVTLILEKDRDDPCCESGEDKLKVVMGHLYQGYWTALKREAELCCLWGRGRKT